MQKGRLYRRILPPNWFCNFGPVINHPEQHYCPAAQWFPFFDFEYAGFSFYCPSGTRLRPKQFNRPEGFIEWAAKFSEGVYDFGMLMRFQLKRDIPEHQVSVRLVDNFGSLLEADLFVQFPRCEAGPFIWLFPPEFDIVSTSGFFDGIHRFSLSPVRYIDEP